VAAVRFGGERLERVGDVADQFQRGDERRLGDAVLGHGEEGAVHIKGADRLRRVEADSDQKIGLLDQFGQEAIASHARAGCQEERMIFRNEAFRFGRDRHGNSCGVEPAEEAGARGGRIHGDADEGQRLPGFRDHARGALDVDAAGAIAGDAWYGAACGSGASSSMRATSPGSAR